MPKSDQERYESLFKKLDKNKDGKVEASELAAGLQSLRGVPDAEKHAQKMMSMANKDESNQLSFNEFIEYMKDHEQKLKLAFSDVDRNKDGKIDPSEVKLAFAKLGLNIDLAEAENLTKRMDKDGNLSLDWTEWRNFFQFYPSGDLETMITYWRQTLMIDIGDDLTCPPEFTKKEKQTGMWWRHLVAGGVAGVVSRTATAPLDRLKILLQVHGSSGGGSNIVSGLRKLIEEGGVKSLWRGNGVNVIKIAPESAIKFGCYEQFKKLIKGDSTTEITSHERFIAGAMAGVASQTAIYPLEVMKTRLAVGKTGQYKGLFHCGMKTFKSDGIFAFYRGYIPNLIGIIPYAGIDLTVYETLKRLYMSKNPDQKNPGVLVLLGCGTISSTCGQLASYPLALIRTRLQAGATEEARKGAMALTKSILKKEGPVGLYRGLAPNFLKVIPAVSISYVVYERAKGFLGL